MITANSLVSHPQFGQGTVRFLEDDVANVRFSEGARDVALADLTLLTDLEAKILAGQSDNPLATISRIQAEAIRSANARWGVFARSKIELLPHQLWVCRRVTQNWPARWLVADDVGLGKTVEAGLIVSSLLSRGLVKRVLVVCPASLVPQWQERFRAMFGIRLFRHTSEIEGANPDFWDDTQAVVASLDTLKLDKNERKNRILTAAPFDLLLVDEAHHLGSGPRETTQAYRFVESLMQKRRVGSAVFFTGTPHRGHDYEFYALLQLLRPEWFDPKRPAGTQIARLGDVLIRNNKALVTDMSGKKLFQDPLVESATYEYSPAEARFYARMSEFIASGQLYASNLDEKEGRAVMLVLIALQKLASSSVAAVAGAIRTRLQNLAGVQNQTRELLGELERAQEWGNDDAAAVLEEKLAASRGALALVEGEEAILRELRDEADAVTHETKIERILELLEGRFAGRSVLFFTEYKATQRLLLEALLERFGPDCAAFINGDDALERVKLPDGRTANLQSDRKEAAREFNAGEIRFLISTEAGGEGIDLQNRCFSLVHVDLPWNPMRLHQRVGRLNRFGQTQRVEVVSLRNPDTVEILVWEHLNAKLARISGSLNAAMDAPEDLSQLVLGLSREVDWNRIHSGALKLKTQGANAQKLGEWFDAQTQTLGDQNLLQTVRALSLQAAHFEFGQHAKALPQADLPDLQPFLDGALALNGKRLMERGFATPDSWRNNPTWGTFLPTHYEEISFNRRDQNLGTDGKRLFGAGHNALEAALDEACARPESFTILPPEMGGENLAIFRVYSRLSPQNGERGFVFGICGDDFRFLEDWQLLQKLNEWSGKRALRTNGLTPQSHDTRFKEWLKTANQNGQDIAKMEDWGLEKTACQLWGAVAKQQLEKTSVIKPIPIEARSNSQKNWRSSGLRYASMVSSMHRFRDSQTAAAIR